MSIKTKEDEIETKRIYDEVLVPILKDSITEYRYEDILAQTDANWIILIPWEYKDKDKNTIIIPNQTFLISFSSEINSDKRNENNNSNMVRTYTIDIDSFNIKKRMYRHHDFFEYNLGVNGYIYAKTLDKLKKKFINKLQEYQLAMDNLLNENKMK